MKNQLHLIGNAHIDPVWLWQWQEGYSEVKSTFAAAIQRLEEYPDFIFTCSATLYYKWIEEDEPELFEKIKKYIDNGRWVIVGGWLIQPDCNIPSGETFARHGLYGQLYFKTKFNKTAETGYSVDSFGQNANLPQLLQLAGMKNYIYQRPGQHEKVMKKAVFNWIAPNGSKVTTARNTFGYTTNTVDDLKERIPEMQKREDENETMLYYGVGNHGGGPTIEMLDYIESVKANNEITYSDPDTWFSLLEKNKTKLIDIKDELQHHASGCYSAHAEIKKKYRQSEQELLCAEKFATLSNSILNSTVPKNVLNDLWEKLLFNTFHDILCGCCIENACNDAVEELGGVRQSSKKIANTAIQNISWKINTVLNHDAKIALKTLGKPVVVFNPHSWEVKVPVRIRTLQRINMQGEFFIVHDGNNNKQHLQVIESDHRITREGTREDEVDGLFIATVPAFGYKTYYIQCIEKPETFVTNDELNLIIEEPQKGQHYTPVSYGSIKMENKHISVEIDKITGGLKNITDKKTNTNIFKTDGAIGLVIDDWKNDTWGHGNDFYTDIIGKFKCKKVVVKENGSVRKVIQTISKYGNSTLTQNFMLYAYDETVRVKAKVDWQEKHAFLKLSFPIASEKCINSRQIPYAKIEKPCTGEEQVCNGWFDVTGKNSNGETMGLTVSSDSKYSFSAENNKLMMTVCRSALYADHGGIRNNESNYSYLDIGMHTFNYTVTAHDGHINPAKAWKISEECKTDYEVVHESYHTGPLPLQAAHISVDAENILLGAFKLAEESENYIVRLFETNGIETTATISLPSVNFKQPLRFLPFEIKTLKANKDGQYTECNFLE